MSNLKVIGGVIFNMDNVNRIYVNSKDELYVIYVSYKDGGHETLNTLKDPPIKMMVGKDDILL